MNIFSRELTLSEMVSRTAGDDCGKADGDYLAWESAEWLLKGTASLGDVSVEDLCRKETKTQIFTAPIGGTEICKNLCKKIQNGNMHTIRNPGEYKGLKNRIDEVLFPNGDPTEASKLSLSAWAPIERADDGSWLDLYNKEPVKDLVWAKGHPQSTPTTKCAFYLVPWNGLASWQCTVDLRLNFIFCPCYFPVRPFVSLRGLCPDSNLDQAYLARNDPKTGFLYFYGTHKTIARFDGKKWNMLSAFFNTSASTD